MDLYMVFDLAHILGQDAATSSTAWRGEFWWQFWGWEVKIHGWKNSTPSSRNPYNRFINPYYGSLDPGTYDIITPWKLNKTTENKPSQKERIVFLSHHFSAASC